MFTISICHSFTVAFHNVHHSFARHLLDKETDIKQIQGLPGHFYIRAALQYLPVAGKDLVNIKSPFADIWKNGGIAW